jgi:hypothetical protein
LIKHFDDEGYLLSFSTPGEGRWVDNSQTYQNIAAGSAEDANNGEGNVNLPKG